MRTTFSTPSEVHNDFKKACIDAGKSMSEVMTDLMQGFVKKQGGKK